VASIAARPPKRISGHDIAHVELVGQRLQRVNHVEVARVQRRVVRLADHTARRIQLRERLGQHRKLAEVLERGVPSDLTFPHEWRPVHGAENHLVAADVHVVGRVPRLHVEFGRRLGDLLEHEFGVQLDDISVDLLASFAEQLDSLWLGELDADLGDDPPPALVKDGDRVRGQDLVTRHLVAEHGDLGSMRCRFWDGGAGSNLDRTSLENLGSHRRTRFRNMEHPLKDRREQPKRNAGHRPGSNAARAGGAWQ
jgi:hypothetical protein